jgi:hypothetical protein
MFLIGHALGNAPLPRSLADKLLTPVGGSMPRPIPLNSVARAILPLVNVQQQLKTRALRPSWQ